MNFSSDAVLRLWSNNLWINLEIVLFY